MKLKILPVHGIFENNTSTARFDGNENQTFFPLWRKR